MNTKQKYIAFCKQHSVDLFSQPYWLDCAYNNNWHVVEAIEENNFAFFIIGDIKKMGIHFWINPPLTPYVNFQFSENCTHEIKQKLIEKILVQLPKGITHLYLHPEIQFHILPKPLSIEKMRTQILTLSNIETIYNNYKQTLQRQIKKANKNLFVCEEDNIELLFELHQKSLAKHNKSATIPFMVLKNYWEMIQKHNAGNLLFIKDYENNIHAGLLLVHDDNTAYYLVGGTNPIFYGSGAMSFLMHKAIEKSILLHKKYFDFEGSMIEGVNRFFKNFSPKETNYIHLFRKDVLNNLYNTWKYKRLD